MAFDFAAAKAMSRRALHKSLGVKAFYQANSLSDPIETRARWHNRIQRFGDDENQGFAEIIEGIERIVLIPEIWELDEDTETVVNTGVAFTPVVGSTIRFPDYQDIVFELIVREPHDGPLEVAWQVSRVPA